MTDRLPLAQHTDDTLTELYDQLEQARRWAVHLENENAELLAELDGRDEEARERWINKQLEETGLKAMDFRNGMTMEIQPARDMVAHWVGAARAMLGDAPNYTETPIEMEVKVGESPERFAFVLQRVAPDALTPHQARQRAEAERDQHAATIAAARGLHQPGKDWSWKTFGCTHDGDRCEARCIECGRCHPCPTIRALDTTEGSAR